MAEAIDEPGVLRDELCVLRFVSGCVLKPSVDLDVREPASGRETTRKRRLPAAAVTDDNDTSCRQTPLPPGYGP